ncbi:phospholipase/carboxylesterase family protein-like protein [Amniculicola lignicola CBS 123094]|uniref:Phospholipase/carboxylesterase family protein-like protein n=1 Tax=Amniculicola lignicola CBS 123094 TaxID=1392246 RepID=A0A6A5WXT1_9PLEO|nr:phospholipase/carboxylesterase family protein-like protein [Amniculicola lignicola CBS 123094]
MSSSKTPNYPQPLVFGPLFAHKSTIIALHGRGSTAEKFATPLLNHTVASLPSSSSTETPQSFQSHFPNTKFIFPTASLRRAVFYNRSLTHQWFDMYPLDQFSPEHKQHVQTRGLRESVTYVHTLIEDAVKEVGAKNVVLMGLSQGCAVSLTSLLIWRGPPLGAFLGMCGWCPLRQGMLEAIGDETGEEAMPEEDDMFELSDDNLAEADTRSKLEKARDWLQEELDISNETGHRENPPLGDMAVFLGHGSEDVKVPAELGRLATTSLQHLDVNVTHRHYDGLSHWYSNDMLRDMIMFIQQSQKARELG